MILCPDDRQADDEHAISLHLNCCSFSGDIIVCGIIATDCRKSSAISVRSADAECVVESRDTFLVMSVSDLDSTVVVS